MVSESNHGKSDGVHDSSKPDFLCIGAQKAATSWLNKVLLEHPNVFMPPVNELHFFDRFGKKLPMKGRRLVLAKRAIRRERKKESGPDRAVIDYVNHLISFPTVSEDWYRAAYSWPVADGVMKGDITPNYMELPESRVAYAREFLGPTKLIMIVRRPLDRLLSQLRMWADMLESDEPPTEQQWLDALARINRLRKRGAYSQGIPRWRSHFGTESLLTLPFSDIRTDPRATIARVEDHIGVPRFDGYSLLTKKIHPTRKYEIPASVRQASETLTASEDAYIRTEFGDAFYERTR